MGCSTSLIPIKVSPSCCTAAPGEHAHAAEWREANIEFGTADENKVGLPVPWAVVATRGILVGKLKVLIGFHVCNGRGINWGSSGIGGGGM